MGSLGTIKQAGMLGGGRCDQANIQCCPGVKLPVLLDPTGPVPDPKGYLLVIVIVEAGDLDLNRQRHLTGLNGLGNGLNLRFQRRYHWLAAPDQSDQLREMVDHRKGLLLASLT